MSESRARKIHFLMIALGVTTGVVGLPVMGSLMVSVIGGVVMTAGLVHLAIGPDRMTSRLNLAINTAMMLLLAMVTLWGAITAGNFELLLGGVAFLGLAGALPFAENSRLVGPLIATPLLTIIAVRYALYGEWLFAAAILVISLLFGRMAVRASGVLANSDNT